MLERAECVSLGMNREGLQPQWWDEQASQGPDAASPGRAPEQPGTGPPGVWPAGLVCAAALLSHLPIRCAQLRPGNPSLHTAPGLHTDPCRSQFLPLPSWGNPQPEPLACRALLTAACSWAGAGTPQREKTQDPRQNLLPRTTQAGPELAKSLHRWTANGKTILSSLGHSQLLLSPPDSWISQNSWISGPEQQPHRQPIHRPGNSTAVSPALHQYTHPLPWSLIHPLVQVLLILLLFFKN